MCENIKRFWKTYVYLFNNEMYNSKMIEMGLRNLVLLKKSNINL